MASEVSISFDTTALHSGVEKLAALVKRLGNDEAERRLGFPISNLYIGRLFVVESCGDTCSLRFVSTADFDRAIAALSGSAALSRAISCL